MGAQPPPHPHIHYAGGCCPLLVGWVGGWVDGWVCVCVCVGVWCWVFGLVGSGEGGSAATVLRGRPVQAPPYKGRSVTAAVAFCLCFLNLFTEKFLS